MTPLRRCLGLLGLCALAVVSSGCNIPALAYFLASPDEKVEPSLQRLASDDKDKKVKVAVIATNGPGVYDQGTRADRELAQLVISHLTDLCKQNKENVSVLPFNAVESYKSKHPDWNSEGIDLVRIGKDLHVRYVIYLEIGSMSLYVPKSQQLYQGQTDIKVQVVNVAKADDLPKEEQIHEMYPESPRDAFETPNPLQFQHEFLDRVATKVCWRFTRYSPEDKYMAK
jgi:hypothetical protein